MARSTDDLTEELRRSLTRLGGALEPRATGAPEARLRLWRVPSLLVAGGAVAATVGVAVTGWAFIPAALLVASGAGLAALRLASEGPADRTRPYIGLGSDVEEGALVEPGAVVEMGATVRRNAVIRAGAVVRMGADVGEGARVEPDAVVEMGATVRRNAVIRAGAVVKMGADIEAGAVIEADAVIWWGATVGEGAVVGRGAEIGAGCDVLPGAQVEPMMRLLPGSTVGRGAPVRAAVAAASDPELQARRRRIDEVCDRLAANLSQAPESAREFLGAARIDLPSLRGTCHALLERESALRRESSAELLASLDGEATSLEEKARAVSDEVARRALLTAREAVLDQRSQRAGFARDADRLNAEHSRLLWTLDGMATQLLRVRDSRAAPTGDELWKSVSTLRDEVDAIADALESVARGEQGPPLERIDAPAPDSRHARTPGGRQRE